MKLSTSLLEKISSLASLAISIHICIQFNKQLVPHPTFKIAAHYSVFQLHIQSDKQESQDNMNIFKILIVVIVYIFTNFTFSVNWEHTKLSVNWELENIITVNWDLGFILAVNWEQYPPFPPSYNTGFKCACVTTFPFPYILPFCLV